MIPQIFSIGPIPLNSFGLMMVCCFLSAARLLAISLKRGGERAELAEPMIFWAAIGGLLGARVWYLVTFYEETLRDPLASIFSSAGFIFYGGFVGGVLGVVILLRREGVSFWRYADLSGPALALGYCVGRIGCHLSGDGDYGAVSELPWAMSYALGVVPTPRGITVHPTPLYESAMALATAYLLLAVQQRGALTGVGRSFGLYLLLSATARFLVELVRIEPVVVLGLTQAQLFAVVIAMLGVLLLVRRDSTVITQ